jgi:hypothetical protein
MTAAGGWILVAELGTTAVVGLLYGAGTFALTLAVAVPVYASKGIRDYPVSIATLWLGTAVLTACFGLLGVHSVP